MRENTSDSEKVELLTAQNTQLTETVEKLTRENAELKEKIRRYEIALRAIVE